MAFESEEGQPMGFLIVFVGGGIGAALRHGFNLAFARLFGTAFPYATLFENVSGSIVMGVLVALFAFRGGIPHHWQLFLTTGILGGYTTFSTFSLDVALLYERGQVGLAALYVLLSVVLSIGGLFAGLALVRNLACVSPSRASQVYQEAPCRGRVRDLASSAAWGRKRSNWRRRGNRAPAFLRSCLPGPPTTEPSKRALLCARPQSYARSRVVRSLLSARAAYLPHAPAC